MAYVTRWRLQLGAQMLASTSHSVAQIASEVGYESEALLTGVQARVHLSSRAFPQAVEVGACDCLGKKAQTH
jgi:AraC-like DNA-binding protein